MKQFKVIDADRKAAAKYVRAAWHLFWPNNYEQAIRDAKSIDKGYCDNWLLVQSFAEHRLGITPAEATNHYPSEILELVRRIGKAEWGATDSMSARAHGRHVAASVQFTAKQFEQSELQKMHGLYIDGTETVICHTGTSPNSPQIARALTGLWNDLYDIAVKEQEQ